MGVVLQLIFWGAVAYLIWRWWSRRGTDRGDAQVQPLSGPGVAGTPAGRATTSGGQRRSGEQDREIILPGANPGIAPGDLYFCSNVRHLGGEDEALFLRDVQAAETNGDAVDFGVQVLGRGRLRIPGFAHRNFAVDPATGRWASAVRLSHDALGLPLARDISSVDGMNMVWGTPGAMFLQPTFLLTGNGNGRIDEVRRIGGAVGDLTFIDGSGGAGRRIVFLEDVPDTSGQRAHLMSCAVTGDDVQTLTTLTGTSGMETIEAHPAGDWLLICASKANHLVDPANGATITLPDAGYQPGWWPAGGSGVLLGRRVEGQRALLFALDLETGTEQLLGPVEGVPDGWDDPYRWVPHSFVAGPDGQMYCLAGLGVAPGHAAEHGSRDRVHLLDLDTRTLTPIEQALVGSNQIFERIHHRPKLAPGPVAGSPPSGFRPADSLMAGLTPGRPEALMAEPSVAAACWTQLRTGVNSYTDPSRPRVEAALRATLPASFEAVRSGNPDMFAQVREAVSESANGIIAGELLHSSVDDLASGTGPWQLAGNTAKRLIDIART